MYFVGRSSQFQLMLLFPAWGLSLALARLAARPLAESGGRAIRLRLRRLLLPACAALIGFGVMVSAIDRLPAPWRQVERSGGRRPRTPTPNTERERYIEASASAGERRPDRRNRGGPPARRARRRGQRLALNGITALVSPDEADLALDQLEDEGGSLVFEAVSRVPPDGIASRCPSSQRSCASGAQARDDNPAPGLRVLAPRLRPLRTPADRACGGLRRSSRSAPASRLGAGGSRPG